MEPKELEKAMLAFVRHDADILVATTIIESGLDIPNANTILIDGAHRHGLADLHQLRGRVGRSSRRGYCYLMIPRGQPLPLDARRRLKAVEEMHDLGAGFRLAMRDLEIRGAGNLLGAEQSGHIHAVGYETYRRLLTAAVARLKRRGEVAAAQAPPACDLSLGIAAALPPGFVPDEEARLQLLREMDRVRTPEEVDALLAAVRDRFGPGAARTRPPRAAVLPQAPARRARPRRAAAGRRPPRLHAARRQSLRARADRPRRRPAHPHRAAGALDAARPASGGRGGARLRLRHRRGLPAAAEAGTIALLEPAPAGQAVAMITTLLLSLVAIAPQPQGSEQDGASLSSAR